MADGHDGAFARFTLVDARALVLIPGARPAQKEGAAPLKAERWQWRCTASPVRHRARGHRDGHGPPGPIGALTVAALLGLGPRSGDRGRAGRAPPGPARALGAEVPSRRPPHVPVRSPRGCRRWRSMWSSVLGNKAAMQVAYQLRRGGEWSWSGRALQPPPFDPNRMLLNELTVTDSFVYDADGFDRALELLSTPGAIPTEVLIESDDVELVTRRAGARAGRRRDRRKSWWHRASRLSRGPRDERRDAAPYYPAGNPKFNHVALSVPSDLLDETNRPTCAATSARSSASTSSMPRADPVLRALDVSTW